MDFDCKTNQKNKLLTYVAAFLATVAVGVTVHSSSAQAEEAYCIQAGSCGNGCGNGEIDNEESCCDPNLEDCSNSYNLCENCDDGNRYNGDGCNEDCRRECDSEPGCCNDGNVCTHDYCDEETSLCMNTPKPIEPVIECDDYNKCTTYDICQQDGTCAGSDVVCEAKDSCHEAGCCDPATGECSNPVKPDGSSCPDCNLCNGNEVCQMGECVGGTPTLCNDGNSCTDDSPCHPLDGTCTYTPNDNPCDDGNVCTENDTCGEGSCQPGTPKNCDDNNICTIDSCQPESCDEMSKMLPHAGCVHTSDDSAFLPCYTGPAGTEGVGACQSGKYQCDDGQLSETCTDQVLPTQETCNGIDDDCDGVVDDCYCGCSDDSDCVSDENPCTDTVCNNGSCAHVPDDSNSCSDNDVCSQDSCVNGACQSEPSSELCECSSDSDCNDENPCTEDSCESEIVPGVGEKRICVNSPDVGSSCSDSNLCTQGDQCNAQGQCVSGSLRDCDDGDICTDDSCNPATGQCINALDTRNGERCGGGSLTGTGDSCSTSLGEAGNVEVVRILLVLSPVVGLVAVRRWRRSRS